MPMLKTFVQSITRNTRGQDIIEYALIAGFMAVTTAAVVPNAVMGVSSMFSEVKSALSASITQTEILNAPSIRRLDRLRARALGLRMRPQRTTT